MLTEVTEAQLERERRDGHRAVFLVAPNYEERSVGSVRLIQRIWGWGGDAGILLLKFRSGRTRVLLDAVKDVNSDRCYSELKNGGLKILLHEVKWPVVLDSFQPLVTRVQSLCREIGSPVDLYVDISALPRSLLQELCERLLHGWSESGIELPGSQIIATINFIYTPADRYPRRLSDDILGSVRGRHTGERLANFVTQRARTTDILLSLSGTGHDAAEVIGSFPEIGGSGVSWRPFFFFSPDSTKTSVDKIAMNAWSLHELQGSGIGPDYFLSVEHLARSVQRDAVGTARKHATKGGVAGNSLYLLAGFGPKVVGLVCFLGRLVYTEHLAKAKGWGESDVLIAGGAQYTTAYSIGAGKTRVYRLQGDFLTRDGGLWE